MKIQTVWKWEIGVALSGHVELMLPRDARVIHFDYDPNGDLCLWAVVNPEAKCTRRSFIILGTGQNVFGDARYLGTIKNGPFMWHLFEEPADDQA